MRQLEAASVKAYRLLAESRKLGIKDLAQGRKYLIVRRALLHCLWGGKDPAALWFFEAWLDKIGPSLKASIDDAYFYMQHVATKPKKSAADIRNLDVKLNGVLDCLLRAADPLKYATCVFVRDILKLPYTWLAEELFRIFFATCIARSLPQSRR
jgi:hypothetical protein